MYNIEKMKHEKEAQLKRRNQFRNVISKLFSISTVLWVLKGLAIAYLVIAQPAVAEIVKGDLDYEQMNTFLSILCVLIIFVRNKDMEEDE